MRRTTSYALLFALGLAGGGCVHHHHHHHYDDDGVVLRIDECPPPVRDHFYHDHPNCDVREVHEIHEDGAVHYHITYVDHGNVVDTRYSHEGDEIRPDQRLP